MNWLDKYPGRVYSRYVENTLPGYFASYKDCLFLSVFFVFCRNGCFMFGKEGNTMAERENEELEMGMEGCPLCSGKHKNRGEKEKRDLMNRLKRIEGQVRGLEGMLENGAYCTDILIQVSAVTSALNSFNKELLAEHVRTCVAENIRKGNDEVIDELVTVLWKLMK